MFGSKPQFISSEDVLNISKDMNRFISKDSKKIIKPVVKITTDFKNNLDKKSENPVKQKEDTNTNYTKNVKHNIKIDNYKGDHINWLI